MHYQKYQKYFSLNRKQRPPAIRVDSGDGSAHRTKTGSGRHEPLCVHRHMSRVPARGQADQHALTGRADQPADGDRGAQRGALHSPHLCHRSLPCL